MHSRERVLAAANRQAVDRIPIDFWAAPETIERLRQLWNLPDGEAVMQRVGCDVRYFRGPGLSAPADMLPGQTFADHWGVVREVQTVTGTRRDGTSYSWTYKHLLRAPLADAATVADIESHQWPDAGEWDYSGVAAACRKIHDAGLAVIFGGDRLDRTAQLKAAMYLRGVENFVADLALEPAMAECLLEHVADYYLDYNRRVFEAAAGLIDIFFMGDDMGTQNSLWVSRDMYRRFFKKRFAAFNALPHKHGAKTMFHTCGKVTELVGEFVDCGLDILQSLQPGAIGDDAARIKREFGSRLSFQGGIDIQNVLPNGSPQQVRDHVRQVARTYGPTGYIFGTAHNVLPDVPTDNLLALIEAFGA